MSPAGQVIAFPMLKYLLAFPFIVDNYVDQGTEILVIRQKPFKFLGRFSYERTDNFDNPSGGTPAFAVSHDQGRTTILLYRKSHWERHVIGD